MATIRKLQVSFAGGEISPEMFGRIDDGKFQAGLQTCRNFIVKPQGPVENRPGFQFVREVKDSTQRTRLISFTFSTTQTVVLEMGAGYFRFYTQGAVITNNAGPYEIANPFAQEDLFDIHYVQSADVLTLVHPHYPPKELRRYGPVDWRLSDIAFTPQIATPNSVSAVPTSGENPIRTYHYVVTAVSEDGHRESSASAAAECHGNLVEAGRRNVIRWVAVPGAARYNIYKLQGGIYGRIGQSTEAWIEDDNISPDLSLVPPIYENVFNAAENYPGAVSYFEQRRCFAGTIKEPQKLWMTRSGTESAMSYSLPVREDDRIAFRVAARESNTIRHIVPLTQLVLLTNSAEWRVMSGNSDTLTPSALSVRPQSYVGASNVQPVIINNTLLYCAARGGHVRELEYSWQADGFTTSDLSLRASHLFDRFDLVEMAYAKAPQPIVWFVSDNGKLLGLTYIPEQQIGAWHWHDTDGQFESCTVVAEGKEDALYVVVKRIINGQEKRYIERMASRQSIDPKDAFFVDCGISYSGPAVNEMEGLDYLEGKTVSILGDGAVFPQQVVTEGKITLDHEVSVVHIGLPIIADLHTLPLAAQMDESYAQGRVKNVNKVWLRVLESSGVFVGPHEHALTEAKQRTTEPYGTPPRLKSEEIQVMLSPSWSNDGRIFVRQSDPLPLTVINLTAEIALGA